MTKLGKIEILALVILLPLIGFMILEALGGLR